MSSAGPNFRLGQKAISSLIRCLRVPIHLSYRLGHKKINKHIEILNIDSTSEST